MLVPRLALVIDYHPDEYITIVVNDPTTPRLRNYRRHQSRLVLVDRSTGCRLTPPPLHRPESGRGLRRDGPPRFARSECRLPLRTGRWEYPDGQIDRNSRAQDG